MEDRFIDNGDVKYSLEEKYPPSNTADDGSIEEVFNYLASPGGRLEKKNLAKAIRSLGIPITEAELASIQGSVFDLQQFTSIVEKHYKEPSQEVDTLKNAFHVLKDEKTQSISKRYLRTLLQTVGDKLSEEHLTHFDKIFNSGSDELDYLSLVTGLKLNSKPLSLEVSEKDRSDAVR